MPDLIIDLEFQKLIPQLAKKERALLEESIATEGCRDPVVVWQGLIADGHNRYEICTRLGKPFKTISLKLETRLEVMRWIIRNQGGRRNLNVAQKAKLGVKLLEVEKKLAAERQKAGQQAGGAVGGRPKGGGKPSATRVAQGSSAVTPAKVRGAGKKSADADDEDEPEPKRGGKGPSARRASDAAGAAFGVSGKTVERMEYLMKHAPPEILEQVEANELEVGAAVKQVKALEKKQARETKRAELAAVPDDALPTGPFSIIAADPPWKYDFSSTDNRKIENQYPTMTVEDICALPIAGIAADNAVLYLWVTNPKMPDGLRVLQAWGFRYVTDMVWTKDKVGMGFWARSQHETVLIGVRGKHSPPDEDIRPSSIIEGKRGKHSAKPDEFYEMIEKLYLGEPKVELFCRTPRKGWAVWGNES